MLAVCSTVAIGLLLAASSSLASHAWARGAYAAAVAASDMYSFASYGGHTGFVYVYTALAMALPAGGPGRAGAMRLIVAHQLGSSAVHKLRCGGLRWLHPGTMRYTLRFLHDSEASFKPHFLVEPPWLRQRWLIALCLRHEWLLGALTVGGVVLELGVLAGCLLGGRLAVRLVVAVGSAFHLATAPLMGIFFPFSIPCYAVGLLPAAAGDPACVLSPPALCAGALLCASTCLSLEDWPLNAMAVFPWNEQQQRLLSSRIGKCTLAHRELAGAPGPAGSAGPPAAPPPARRAEAEPGALQGARASSICVAEVASSLCAANYYPGYPEHERARRSTALLEPKEGRRIAEELVKWLRATQRFVDVREGGHTRCFDDVMMHSE